MEVKDLIERQAAIDAVHKEFDECLVWDESGETTANEIERILEALPSAQPETIRCKDCIKREVCRTSTVWAVAPPDDWYCADAERREDAVN